MLLTKHATIVFELYVDWNRETKWNRAILANSSTSFDSESVLMLKLNNGNGFSITNLSLEYLP